MVISICKFLRVYYGISLDASLDYSHKLLKKHFKFLRTCSFDFAASNAGLVKTGKLIYVSDSYGLVYPYICPDNIMTSSEECKYTPPVIKADTESDILDELATMPDYIVHELLSKYKSKPSFYRMIKRELMKRGTYENKKYKLRKEMKKMELEESEYNDKYQRRREIKYKKS